jgi:selT/selW/selH-like putative selenoprotein
VRDSLQAKGIDDVECKAGRSGQFDVVIDGNVVYSRYQTGRFPSEEEIGRLLAP